MHYVSAEEIGKSYGIQPLFKDISFHIEEGDKIALVARNGSGKSTLLKILAGLETPDQGKIWVHKDVDVVFLQQEPVFAEEKSVLDDIFFYDHPVIKVIKQYEAAVEENNTAAITEAIIKMDESGAWDFEAKVKQVLGRLNIHQFNQPVHSLSGGQRKRVALARTLIDTVMGHKHIFLILDEPTNHLDVEMVEWLENYLDKENITILLVTHDRYFLDTVCNEIWELENDMLYNYHGGYEDFLEKKVLREENEQATIDKARNRYRKELEWMRKQPKARTTKSKSRQDNFYKIEKTAKQQIKVNDVQLDMKMSRLGGKILELKKVYKSFGDTLILKGFDYTFKKGERIGIVGKNGIGKSTFINILQGLEKADNGKINIGETVIFGNYSQQGLLVKEDMRVIEYVKSIAENFPLAGGGSLNASQFLELFLFDADKQYTFISKLSGGEKKRLHLLTILFRNPNFLMLDEPTNDLDLPTLNVLENFLLDFRGCMMIVSHDRYFMDRLVDHLFVFEGNGIIRDFPGNYSQFRDEQLSKTLIEKPLNETRPRAAESSSVSSGSKTRQLSFKEKREFEMLEKEMADLAIEKKIITEKLATGILPFEELEKLSLRIGEVSNLLDEKELRWLELSEIQ